jgi:hypothetical protein
LAVKVCSEIKHSNEQPVADHERGVRDACTYLAAIRGGIKQFELEIVTAAGRIAPVL